MDGVGIGIGVHGVDSRACEDACIGCGANKLVRRTMWLAHSDLSIDSFNLCGIVSSYRHVEKTISHVMIASTTTVRRTRTTLTFTNKFHQLFLGIVSNTRDETGGAEEGSKQGTNNNTLSMFMVNISFTFIKMHSQTTTSITC